jgi:hypothetical protein
MGEISSISRISAHWADPRDYFSKDEANEVRIDGPPGRGVLQ